MRIVAVFLGWVIALPVSAQSDEAKETLVRKLQNQRLSVEFERVPLEDVIDYFRDATGIDFMLDLEPGHPRKVSVRLTNVRLKSVLRLILGSHGLTAVYREGVLLILPRDRAGRTVNTQVYDVRDLLLKKQDFPGPSMELTRVGCGINLGSWDDLNPPPQGADQDFLVEMIAANTGGMSWGGDGNTSLKLANGFLVVTQSGKVQAEIRRVLNLLRQTR